LNGFIPVVRHLPGGRVAVDFKVNTIFGCFQGIVVAAFVRADRLLHNTGEVLVKKMAASSLVTGKPPIGAWYSASAIPNPANNHYHQN